MSHISSTLLGGGVLVCCYLFGEWAVAVAGLPVPGAIVGMLLLFCILQYRRRSPGITTAAKPLLGHMALLFVPAIIGVMLLWSLVKPHLVSIVLALVLTTILSLGMTALLAQRLLRVKTKE